jgi:hypothetical protein
LAKKNARNSDLLRTAKAKSSLPIYSLLVDLVNDDREDLAEVVLRIDYLLEYGSRAIKQKDFEEARDGLDKAKARLDILKKENVDITHLEKLYLSISSKCKA